MNHTKPHTLLNTVGTSLLTNCTRAPDSELKQFIASKNVQGTIAELLNHPSASSLSAELNSITSIIQHNYLSIRQRCLFLVSDTPEGRFIGAVLKEYYSSGKSTLRFEETEYQVIDGLNDNDIRQFRNTGLRNLVRLIGKETRKTGAANIIINATGGYKAQISFAGMIGQALGIAVAYMHEKFSDVILLPPQPVNLDMEFWLENGEDFFALNNGTAISEQDYLQRDSRFGPLIESIEGNGELLTALNATGQLFHETFSEKFAHKHEGLLPKPCMVAPENKKRTYEDANSGKHPGLETYLNKICKESFVVAVTTCYYNPDLNAGTNFKISAGCRPEQVEGIYSNNGQSTNYYITTTAIKESERKACLVYLLNNLQSGCY
ncbi:MAG TPA: putative CRISPR-associated protein [Chitinispirillaceae bacterium]|nr:putative CRISPR-associated protein [Chitinispirillaceae bacterium]